MYVYILESRVGPDTFLAGYRIPDIRLIFTAGYPVSGRISGVDRISGRLPDIRPDNRILQEKNKNFVEFFFGTIWYYALGAQIPPPYF